MRNFKITQSITKRNEDCVNKYLVEISHIDLMDADEEQRLAPAIASGDKAALDKLIKANLRFVVSVAKQFQNKGMSLADLINEGNLGLIRAANKFDPTKGFKFISFAVHWIRQGIVQAIAEQKRTVRLPGNRLNDLRKIGKEAARLEQELERLPTLSELAEALEMPEEKIAEANEVSLPMGSLDMQFGDENDHSLLDIVADVNAFSPESMCMANSLVMDVQRMLGLLPFKEQEILKYSFGIDGYPELIIDDIAERLGLTKERIRQLRVKAIKFLQRERIISSLRDYV